MIRVFVLSIFVFVWMSLQAQKTEEEFNSDLLKSKPMNAYLMYQLASGKKDKLVRYNELVTVSRVEQNDFLLVKAFNMQANWYRQQGDYIQARTLLDSAIWYLNNNRIKGDELKYSRDGSSVYDTYEELASIYIELGNYVEARRWYLESIAAKEANLKKGDLRQVNPYLGLANLKRLEGNPEEAIAGYEEVLKRLHKVMSTMKAPYQLYAQTYIAMASTHFELGDFKQSLKSATLGLKIVNDPLNIFFLFGQKAHLSSELNNLKAQAYLYLGDIEKAQKFYDKATEAFLEAYSREDNGFTELIKTEIGLAKIQGQTEQTFDLLEELMDNHLRYLDNNFVSLSEREKEDFYDRVKEDVNFYYEHQLSAFLAYEDPIILERILNRQLTTKAFILSDINRTKRGILESGNQELITAFETYQDIKTRIATLTYSDPSNKSLDSLKLVLGEQEKYLSQASDILDPKSSTVDWKQVRRGLKPEEVAIECIRISLHNHPYYLMLMIRPDQKDLSYVLLENGDELENKAIKAYRANMIYKMDDKKSFEAFWQPIADQLPSDAVVYFSPDGVYHQVALATLYDDRTGKYVVEKHRILNVTNTKDLMDRRLERQNPEVVLIGRPDYDFEDQSYTDASLQDKPIMLRSNMSMSIDKFFDQNFTDLPGTSEEVFTINQTLKAGDWDIRAYLGSEASEEQVKSVSNPGIMHIATHGFFLGGNEHLNPMMKSGLVLAGVKNQNMGKQEDGVLTAYEATGLKLDRTNLVVLSACETALGDIKEGEGVYGLQRAFIVAGAKKLVMSMWKVNDEATRDLMIALYKRMTNGLSVEEAFRQAQLEVKQQYNHPNYWGAFVLITS